MKEQLQALSKDVEDPLTILNTCMALYAKGLLFEVVDFEQTLSFLIMRLSTIQSNLEHMARSCDLLEEKEIIEKAEQEQLKLEQRNIKRKAKRKL